MSSTSAVSNNDHNRLEALGANQESSFRLVDGRLADDEQIIQSQMLADESADNLTKLTELGYTKGQATQALEVSQGEFSQALNFLLMGDRSREGFLSMSELDDIMAPTDTNQDEGKPGDGGDAQTGEYNELLQMGYSDSQIQAALRSSCGDLTQAIVLLMNESQSMADEDGDTKNNRNDSNKNEVKSQEEEDSKPPAKETSNETTAISSKEDAVSYGGILDLGYTEEEAQEAMGASNGDVTKAIMYLMSGGNKDTNDTNTPETVFPSTSCAAAARKNDDGNRQSIQLVNCSQTQVPVPSTESVQQPMETEDSKPSARATRPGAVSCSNYEGIVQMGYSEEQAIEAMRHSGGDVTRAIYYLMGESRSGSGWSLNSNNNNNADPNEAIEATSWTRNSSSRSIDPNSNNNVAVVNRGQAEQQQQQQQEQQAHEDEVLTMRTTSSAENKSKPGVQRVANYDRILQMGYTEEQAIEAMRATHGNVTRAIFLLMGDSCLVLDTNSGNVVVDDDSNTNNNLGQGLLHARSFANRVSSLTPTTSNQGATTGGISRSQSYDPTRTLGTIPDEGSNMQSTGRNVPPGNAETRANTSNFVHTHSGDNSYYNEILQMGYTETQAQEAMRVSGGDVTQAINYLLMGESRSGFNAAVPHTNLNTNLGALAAAQQNRVQQIQEQQRQLLQGQHPAQTRLSMTRGTPRAGGPPNNNNANAPRMVSTSKSLTRIPRGIEACAFCTIVAASRFLHGGGVVNCEFLDLCIDYGTKMHRKLDEEHEQRLKQQAQMKRKGKTIQQQPLAFFMRNRKITKNINSRREGGGNRARSNSGDKDSELLAALEDEMGTVWKITDVISRLGPSLGVEPMTEELKHGNETGRSPRRTLVRNRNQRHVVPVTPLQGSFEHTFQRGLYQQAPPPPQASSTGIRTLLAQCRNEQQTGTKWLLLAVEVVVTMTVVTPSSAGQQNKKQQDEDSIDCDRSYDSLCICLPPKGSPHKFWLLDAKPRQPFRVPGAYARVHANMMQLVESLETIFGTLATQRKAEQMDMPMNSNENFRNVVSFTLHPISPVPLPSSSARQLFSFNMDSH